MLVSITLLAGGCATEGPAKTGEGRGALLTGAVAILSGGGQRAYEAPIEPFRTALRRPSNRFELPDGDAEARALMDALLATRPPLIFAVGADALGRARERAPGVPIVFAMVVNHAKYGLEGAPDVAGVALEVPPEIQFTDLLIVVPSVRRLGVIHSRITRELVEHARAAAGRLGLTLEEETVSAAGDVEDAWARLKGRIDALWMVPDGVAIDAARFVFLKDATIAARMPFMGFSDSFVKAGCLLSLSADYRSIGSQAGVVASRILAGEARPRDCGVAPPAGTILAVNVGVAKAIGLTIDPEALGQADEVEGAE